MSKVRTTVHESDLLSKSEIESIDAHIAAHEDHARIEKAKGDQNNERFAKARAAVNFEKLSLNLCDLVHKGEPILKVVRRLLFWKPSWQAVIDQIIAAADELCPVAN